MSIPHSQAPHEHKWSPAFVWYTTICSNSQMGMLASPKLGMVMRKQFNYQTSSLHPLPEAVTVRLRKSHKNRMILQTMVDGTGCLASGMCLEPTVTTPR